VHKRDSETSTRQETIMSTIITHFDESLSSSAPAKRALGRLKLLADLRSAWDAAGEGFAAARRYQELTRRGMSHEQAASKVFFEHYAGR
jgi:hypothetical protein